MSNKKAKGKRSKTRDLFKRRHIKTKVNGILREFSVGDKVMVRIDPSHHKGFLHRRFQNMSGKIVEKRGKAYVLAVVHGDKAKQLVTTSAHLLPA